MKEVLLKIFDLYNEIERLKKTIQSQNIEMQNLRGVMLEKELEIQIILRGKNGEWKYWG